MNKEKERSPYETLLTLCLALLIVHLVWEYPWALYASLGLGLSGLFLKTLADFIHRTWMQFSHFIGTIMTHILLLLVFYVLLWPIALLYRWAGKSRMKKSVREDSNYVEREHLYTSKDLENMW